MLVQQARDRIEPIAYLHCILPFKSSVSFTGKKVSRSECLYKYSV